MRLCGISSRFQLLSPCTRQVTHALLTRPPLSHKIISPEGNQIKCFVRLACVKHAASVHPEPGSNSHVKKLISVKLNLANLSLLLFFKDLSIVRFYDFKKNFRGMCFTVQLSKIGFALPFVSNSFAIISCRFLPVKNFFQLF